MKYFITGLVCFLVLPTYADTWTGRDKAQHAAVGAGIGAAITASTKDPMIGCAAAAAVGAAKEIYDHQHPQKHTASFKDFAVTSAFGCASSYTAGWMMSPKEVRYTFSF